MVGAGKRPRNKIYIVSKRRQPTGNRISNAKKAYEKLLRREKHEGKTTWLAQALEKMELRLKKMGLKSLTKNS